MAADIGLEQACEPLLYHGAIRAYLKREEAPVWQWYRSHRVREEHAETLRLDLLKSTYRLTRDAHGPLYAMAGEVSRRLGLGETPVTIYQAQDPAGLNASLAYLPDGAHIVLHGPIMTKLSEPEIRAAFAHELGHLLLYRIWDGDLLVTEQVLSAMTHDRDADTPHFASARLFSLYTEVFCDRVALSLSGQVAPVVSMLVKIATGLDEVNPDDYLQQADEIVKGGRLKTEGVSHPEAFMRAHVLRLWQERGDAASAEIVDLIEGHPVLDELDLLGQERVVGLTRRLIDLLLVPQWLRTELVVGHARMFFDGYEPRRPGSADESLGEEISRGDDALLDYFCYVILDFATADRELEEAPLAHSVGVAESLGLQERFAEIAAKELRLRKSQLEKISAERQSIVAAASGKSEAVR